MYSLALLALVLNLAYWLFLFSRLGKYNDPSGDDPDTVHQDKKPLLVLAVKNESSNLKKHFSTLLQQTGGDYEVLVIDDHSEDDTAEIIRKFQRQHPNLRFIQNQEGLGKKRSLQQHLLAEKADMLVLTDGDCRPATVHWLSLMTRKIRENHQIVLGYAPFFRRKSLVNLFARYENVLTALQYLSYALAGIPYMGVGRNLAYCKTLFDRQNGFQSHLDIRSGDDDLFINQVATPDNTTIQIHPDSFVYSEAPPDWKGFFRQKRRHLSTSTSYKLRHQVLLSFFAASHLVFYFSLLTLDFPLAFLLWSIRLILILVSNFWAFKKLKATDLLAYLPVLDVMLLVYYLVMGIFSIFPQRKIW